MPIRKKKQARKKKQGAKPKQTRPNKSIVNHVYLKKNKRRQNRSPTICDKVQGVERLLAPFSKFYKKKTLMPRPATVMVSNSPKTGLTPKERNYVICSCQKRTNRYARLKCLANEAVKRKNIFLMYSTCKPVREALTERGWVEKILPSRMDLSTIRNRKFKENSDMHMELERLLLSNLVEKAVPNFIWNMRDGFESEFMIQNHKVVHNKQNMAVLWATKQGLCSCVSNSHWYNIEGVAEVNIPRTYNSSYEGEKCEFESDYKLTACTSLLKWVLSMVANDQPIFVESGNIAMNVLVFALNRCKDYLFRKQNKDIDKSVAHTSNEQWNSFLKKYYILIAKEDTFKADVDNKLPLYIEYAKFMIKEIHKYRPQLSCEGCHNIWIIKPAQCSRGRGIRMASKLGVLSDLLNKDKYVFQKYIEESLLIHKTKFDIRQYYLVTSTFPLQIWMYQDCYLKFSSQKYNLKNYHESIHLTNNAVQRKYKNCTDRHPELPQQNMWSLATFKQYLFKTGKGNVWDNIIYPGMRKSIVGIMLSCQESAPNWKNRFELYGCDFILDKDYNPWLIEINSGPDLNPTTKVTAVICPAVLSDVIKVVVDRAANQKACTGKFECIYNQTIHMRPLGRADDLIVQGFALPNEYFYRGILPTEDDNNSVSNIGKQQDIATLLNKLKSIYITDKKEEHKKGKCFKKVYCQNSVSDNGVDGVSVMITEQMHNILVPDTPNDTPLTQQKQPEQITSVESFTSSANFREQETQRVYVNKSHIIQFSGVKHNITRFGSEHPIRYQFGFSDLDDGPQGKGSGLICLSPVERPNRITSFPSFTKEKQDVYAEGEVVKKLVNTPKPTDVDTTSGVQKEEINNNFICATQRILSFLNRKKDEYIVDTLQEQNLNE